MRSYLVPALSWMNIREDGHTSSLFWLLLLLFLGIPMVLDGTVICFGTHLMIPVTHRPRSISLSLYLVCAIISFLAFGGSLASCDAQISHRPFEKRKH
jgi:hypothetical protein